eukprot:1146639-Rhodomonas_salina.1
MAAACRGTRSVLGCLLVPRRLAARGTLRERKQEREGDGNKEKQSRRKKRRKDKHTRRNKQTHKQEQQQQQRTGKQSGAPSGVIQCILSLPVSASRSCSASSDDEHSCRCTTLSCRRSRHPAGSAEARRKAEDDASKSHPPRTVTCPPPRPTAWSKREQSTCRSLPRDWSRKRTAQRPTPEK